MRLLVTAVSFFYLILPATAADKPTLPPQLQKKFEHAVDLLESFRGNASDLETARTELNEILKTNARYAPAHRELGRYFIMRGHINTQQFQPGSLEAADSAIRRAIQINPNYAEAYVLQGHLFRLMDRPQEAEQALKKAENIGTSDPWLQNNWADLLTDEGKHEEAARRYRNVIESKTANKKAVSSAYGGLIRSFMATGKVDQADEIYRKLIDLEPETAWGYGNYAHFLLCTKDDAEKSISYSRKALAIMNYGAGRYWLAAGLYRKWAQSVIAGNKDDGKAAYAEASQLHPDANQIAGDWPSCRPLKFLLIAKAVSSQVARPTHVPSAEKRP